MPTSVDALPVDARRKANRARLIQQLGEIHPLECPNRGTITGGPEFVVE